MVYEPPTDEALKRIGNPALQEEFKTSAAAAYRRRVVNEHIGELWGIFSSFEMTYQSSALYWWFAENNLPAFLENAYLMVKANIMTIHTKPTFTSGCSADGKALLYALILNDEALLHWHSQFTLPFLGGGINERLYKSPYEYQHLCLQIRLALPQNWGLLAQNCEQALATEPKQNKLYRVDYTFLKALAAQDPAAMQGSLDELLSPKVLRHRHGGWGREEGFFAAWAMIYFKLAQRAGFTLETNSPWMPQAWLPPQKLNVIPSSYDFIDDFDIFTPFYDNPNSGWCKSASQFTPRPLGQPLLLFQEVEKAFEGLVYQGGL